MVAWWALDEGSGTLAQELVAGNDGTDASALSPAKVTGAVMNARQFDGASGVIRVPDLPKLDLGINDLTLDAWVQTSSIAPLLGIVEKRQLSPDRGYALYLKQGKLALHLGDGSVINEYWASSASAINDNKWHHVAATVDRADGLAGTRLYVDGALIASFPGYPNTSTLTNAEKLVIGAQEPSLTPTGWFAGRIDEVEIFKRALSNAEIAKIWGAGPAGKCKESVRAPKAQTICTGQTSVIATIKLCNLGGSTQLFNLTFTGIARRDVHRPAAAAVRVPVGGRFQQPHLRARGGEQLRQRDGQDHAADGAHEWAGVVLQGDLDQHQHQRGARVEGVDLGQRPAVPDHLRHRYQLGRFRPGGDVPLEAQEHVAGVPGDAGDRDGHAGGGRRNRGVRGIRPDRARGAGRPGVRGSPSSGSHPARAPVWPFRQQFRDERPFHSYDIMLEADANQDGESDTWSSNTFVYSDHPPVTVDVPRPALPTEVHLLGVTPNPFTRTAKVNFEMPQPGWVRVALYDVSGRLVRQVGERLATAGRQAWTLESTQLPSGVYFVRLEAAGIRQTARIVLLRE